MDVKKVVLAYSGGLDTSCIIPWLKENYGCEVIAVAVDVGQGAELDGLEEKAIKSGASKLYIEDVREEFIENYIWPTMKAGSVYENKYLLGTSFARPIIAKKMVEIAHKEGADAIAHGCTGKGNDQVRFELTIKAFDPDIKIIAPWRIWELKSREEEVDYATARGIKVAVTKEHNYSMDKNIWHLSHEGSDLEDPWNEPHEDMFMVSKAPTQASDEAEYVELEYVKGIPTKVNGKELGAIEIIETLNAIGAKHGIGIVDLVENRLVGMKSRGVYENPGGAILYAGIGALESITLDRQTLHFKQHVALKFAELVYDGQWFTPLRKALCAFVDDVEKVVTGTVKLKLYKGNIINAGVKSPYSIYNQEYVTFEEDSVYDQKDAAGFINLTGLSILVRAKMLKANGKTIEDEID